jgi:hypothetical protein
MSNYGLAVIDKSAMEDGGVLVINHYKPLADEPTVEVVYEFDKELKADEQFMKFVKEEEMDWMIVPTIGLLPQAMGMMAEQSKQIKFLLGEIDRLEKSQGVPQAPGATDGGLILPDHLKAGATPGIVTPESSNIPMGAQMIMAGMEKDGGRW